MKEIQESTLQKRFRFQRDLALLDHPADSYLLRNEQGYNCIHLAAAFGGIDALPKEILTSENLGSPNENGDTPLHLAAKSGRIYQLPLEDLPISCFLKQNKQGENTFTMAAARGHLDQIPEKIRAMTPENVHAKIMSWMCRHEENLSPQYFDPAVWTRLLRQNGPCTTYLHLAAQHHLLDKLPALLTSPSFLTIKDEIGQTPLSLAISLGSLSSIWSLIPSDFDWSHDPKLPGGQSYYHLLARAGELQLLNEIPLEELSRTNSSGVTVFDELDKAGHLDILPEEIRWHHKRYRESRGRELIEQDRIDLIPSEFDWCERMQDGTTLLHHAARVGTLAAIPESLLCRENLELTTTGGETVITTAFKSGHILAIPQDLRYLAEGYVDQFLSLALTEGSLKNFPSELKSPGILLRQNSGQKNHQTHLHRIASAGLLAELPVDCLTGDCLATTDANGNNILHTLVLSGQAATAPDLCFTHPNLLLGQNRDGKSVFHLASCSPVFGGLQKQLFTEHILLLPTPEGPSIANLIEDHGNTALLPPELRILSSKKAKSKLDERFTADYFGAEEFWEDHLKTVLSKEEFQAQRTSFVSCWFESYPELSLDNQQARAVAEWGGHVQLVARAGSGKTRTLVARALFQIKHLEANARQILILAFNRKAVSEVRERLAKYLKKDELPHVLTFHALAWRVVKPNEKLLFDPDGADEKKLLSQTIKRIVEERFRHPDHEKQLKTLLGLNWQESLELLFRLCFHLEPGQRLDLLENLQEQAIDGRRVESTTDKWVYNFLLQHGLEFRYRRQPIHYFGGGCYRPTFVIERERENSVIIETTKASGTPSAADLRAEENFLQGANALKYQFIKDLPDPEYACSEEAVIARKTITGHLKENLKNLGIKLTPLPKEKLWEKVRDRTISDFTKSIRQFVTRCQKELVWPDKLQELILIHGNDAEEIPHLFWNEALEIYRRYEEILKESHFTDFDRLILRSASLIADGQTTFKSTSGHGNLRDLTHIYIDEFQDFSHLFNELRKSLVKVSPRLLFFCVGDDWQAINRFAGSNTEYFETFCSDFKPSIKLELTTNYRSAVEIVAAGNKVMGGHGSPSTAFNTASGQILRCDPELLTELTSAEELVRKKNGDLGCVILRLAHAPGMPFASLPNSPAPEEKEDKKKVVVLSRRTEIPSPTGMRTVEKWEKGLRKYLPNSLRDRLEFSTTHGYKGREADTVILLNPEDYPLCHQDSIFYTILGETASDLLMDELRLFYVGVTRAKENLILLRSNTEKKCHLLPGYDGLRKISVANKPAQLVSGEDGLISIVNLPSVTDIKQVGTMPLKDEIKKSGFDGYTTADPKWSYPVQAEQLLTAKSLLALMKDFEWVKRIEQVQLTASTDTVTYQFEINHGHFKRTDACLTQNQKDELEILEETTGPELPPILEALHLDLKIEWPEFGFEGTDKSGLSQDQLELAWPNERVGLHLPGDSIEVFRRDGWRLVELTPGEEVTWERRIINCFHHKPSLQVRNEGILHLYHFSDVSNIESIRAHGILSNKALEEQGIEYAAGGNEKSIGLDREKELDKYVHLCLTPHHPMAVESVTRGTMSEAKFLRVSPEILNEPGVKGCLEVSASKHAQLLDIKTFLTRIDWEAWKYYWNRADITGLEDFTNHPIFKFEILVPDKIAKSHILTQ